MNRMYEYTQNYLKTKQTSDVLKRKAKVVLVTTDRTSFSIGTLITITGKESQDNWRGQSTKGKTGYVEHADIELLPMTREEFKIAQEDVLQISEDLGHKISYFEETKVEEFDAADFAAWTVVKALKDQKDDETIRKEIVKCIMSFSTVTS